MDKDSRRYVSLRTKAFRAILAGSLILILTFSTVGLLLHAYVTIRQFKNEARHLMDSMMTVQDMDYIENLFKETREIYYSMPPELHEEFYQEIEDVHNSYFGSLADEDYKRAKEIMAAFHKNVDAVNMLMFFPDPEANNYVFVLDGETDEYAYPPGGWLKFDDEDKEAVEKELKGVEKTSKSDWMLDIIVFNKNGFYAADYIKVYSKEGEFLGYVDAEIDMTEFVKGINRFLLVLIPVAVVTVFLLAFLTSKMLRNHIITYLKELSDAAVAYTERDNAAIDETTESVFEPLDIRTADEIEDLWNSMAGMESDVRNSIVRLRKMTAEKEYAEAELSIASQIQSGMLPSKFPDDRRFELYASMDPAREVGGDLYDFFMIDDDHLALVIADVSGKGVSASLFMVTAKNFIKSQTEKGVEDPAEIFNRVNRQLMDVNKAFMFVTAWLGILKLSTGELMYANAGHEYPALKRKGGLFEVVDDIHSVPLAARKKMTFDSGSFTLSAGDTLFVYTDGVPEANNTEGRMMGKERMLEALNSVPDADPETIINNVKSAVGDFAESAPQFDDTTMLCLRYLGPDESRASCR